MKKLLLLPLLVLPLLTGCDGNKEVEKYHLTFGSKMQLGNEDAIKELSSSELLAKTRDEKEVFLLAVYQGEYSETCLCWNTYQEALKNYCFNYSGLVYLYNAQNVEPTMSHLKIEKLNESTPYLYIFNGEKLIQNVSKPSTVLPSSSKSSFKACNKPIAYVSLTESLMEEMPL